MRIGFFTDTYLPTTHGVEVSIETLRKNLEAMGHRVFIYAPESPGYEDKNPNVFRFKAKKIIKKPEISFAFSSLPSKRNFREIERLKLDIAHAHTPFSLGILAKYIAERQIIPLIYTHHTHYPEYAKVYLKENLLLPYLAKVYSTWFSNISDAVIAPSVKIKKLLQDYGINKKVPIHILPTGVDLKIFKKSPRNGQILRKKIGISSNFKILLSVSRLGKEKNVEFLLKAFAEVLKKRKDVFLLIVGDGPFLEQLKKTADNLNISRYVIFEGRISHEEIAAYYQAADIFLFASLTETQGIVILEALASGLPQVVLKDDAFTNIVLNKRNGFIVAEQKPELFARKIIEILDSPSFYKKFSAEAIKTAKRFSEKDIAQQMVEIYQTQIKKYYRN